MTSQSAIKRHELELIALLEEEAAYQARKDVIAFTQFTKPKYSVNWHHRLIGDKINQWLFGDLRFLILLAPPRSGKSEIVSRRLPAFIHGLNPDAEIMTATYSATLSGDMTRDVQSVFDEPSFQFLFPNSKIAPPGKKIPKAIRNSSEHSIIGQKGTYRGQGVGGSFSGRGMTHGIIDDPVKGRESANSQVFREKLWSWYQSDFRTRLAPNGRILITLTRWHNDDLAGRLIKQMETEKGVDQFEVVSLPAIFDGVDTHEKDPRKIDEALWPERWPIEELRKLEKSDPRSFISLYQQKPGSVQGNIILRDWIQYYEKPPERFTQLVQSWDLSFSGNQNNDFVVGQVWGVFENKKYLLDQVRARMGFVQTCEAMRAMSKKWPKAYRKLVEAKANGAAVIDSLKHEIGGIVPINPTESKTSRLEACSTHFAAKEVFYPNANLYSWAAQTIEELLSFPAAKHDDTVDATTQFLNHLGQGSYLTKLMQS
jgi:predicted phage terminase large subunit-like protein